MGKVVYLANYRKPDVDMAWKALKNLCAYTRASYRLDIPSTSKRDPNGVKKPR